MDESVMNRMEDGTENSREKSTAEEGAEEIGCENQDSFLLSVKEQFHLQMPDPLSYSGLALAFVGDGAYELVIRTLIAGRGNMQVKKMHRMCSELVKAPAQAAMVHAIFDRLTKEEQAVCKRGHNTKPHTKAKNADMEEYLWATGLEALCGWLYLTGQQQRLMEVIHMGMDALES